MKILSFLTIILLWLFSSCDINGGDKFIGTWKDQEYSLEKLTINKWGNGYQVQFYKFIYPIYEQSFTTTAEYQDNNLLLDINSNMPRNFSTRISYSNEEIFYNGDTYKNEAK